MMNRPVICRWMIKNPFLVKQQNYSQLKIQELIGESKRLKFETINHHSSTRLIIILFFISVDSM